MSIQFVVATVVVAVIVFGFISMILSWYKKANQGQAIVRTGLGGTKVSFNGMIVIPVIHKHEIMDITIKKIVTSRLAKDGLICKDNMRADIQTTFFVRVNKTIEDVKKVAETIGASRASDQKMLESLFDAKFSEALKTVGKRFDFVDLYNTRDEFKKEILQIIGKDLNGYLLDDCAIDQLEQTQLIHLDEQNILDAEGIKKITELTSKEKVKANLIQRDKEKVIKQQDVEARETILQLEKQLKEKEEQQRREIETIKYREQAEIDQVKEEENQKSELARIEAQEEILIKEENKQRQVEIARLNKERARKVEMERVHKEQQLESTEREKIVALAEIDKEKALEEQRRDIQEVIRERVTVEKAVVEEQEKIKDTEAFAQAEREKSVALTKAEKEAQEALVKEIKAAEAAKHAAEHQAKTRIIEAQAAQEASTKEASAIKILAEAAAAEVAAAGMGEAQVIEAKAAAMEKKGASDAQIIEMAAKARATGEFEQGQAEANIMEAKALAMAKQGESEAKVIQLRASAVEERGMAEARVEGEKYSVEAKGIEDKAEAMKKLDGVGREHEEFKLRLENDKEIELAQINIQRDIANAQADVIGKALQAAKIDIVGGESMFFDQIVGAITKGKKVDRMLDNSETLTQVKDTFFGGKGGADFKTNFRNFIDQFGLSTSEIKDLSVAGLLNNLANKTSDSGTQSALGNMLNTANVMGLADKAIGDLGILD